MKAAILLLILLLCGCSAKQKEKPMETMQISVTSEADETTAPTASFEPELLTVLVSPKDEDFVRVKDYIPDIFTELKYGTSDNFTGQVIYEFEDVFLRYGTVMKLKAVSEEFAQQQLYLKIWDGFRPVSAQFKLWEICPDDTYVANPNIGYSNHSRGFAVDVTLVDENGKEIEMPTAYDDFSAKADRDYTDCSEEAAANARLLETVMERHGFSGYRGEWWHFNDTQKYDVETSFDPGIISRRYVNTDTVLLETFWKPESGILQIPAGEGVTFLGYSEEYALVEYWGYRGYVAQENLLPLK